MDNVGFTADAIAARRTLMGLPYVDDIYKVLFEKVSIDEKLQLEEALKPENASLIPFFESRYRILDKLIGQTGIQKILEVAAGFAPRSLIWTENPAVTYVEVDLPFKIGQKREVVNTLIDQLKINPRTSLYFEEGDVLDMGDLSRAVKHLGHNGPIIIANEGLLRYLTHDQKKIVAENFKKLLERFGGYWITPDINLAESFQTNPLHVTYTDKIQSRLGTDINANVFKSIAEGKAFFEDLGFTVEEHSFMEVANEIVCAERINMSDDKIKELIGWRVAFVMKLK